MIYKKKVQKDLSIFVFDILCVYKVCVHMKISVI